jgi:hypothetical protein
VKVREIADDTIAEATGQTHRHDPVLAATGGPAGNARLTAWTGLVLLVLFAAELVTVLDVRGLISWHIVLGVLLVPPALVKTVSTGWRIARYYTGNRSYRQAGPPPLVLRVLGPLVVLTTLGVLGSGLLLILVGPDAGRRSLVPDTPLSMLGLHKATFLLWCAGTGLHTLGRLVPALRLTVLPGVARVPGRYPRIAALALSLLVGAVAAGLVLAGSSAWRAPDERFPRPEHRHAIQR